MEEQVVLDTGGVLPERGVWVAIQSWMDEVNKSRGVAVECVFCEASNGQQHHYDAPEWVSYTSERAVLD
jgi:hypothetical protein